MEYQLRVTQKYILRILFSFLLTILLIPNNWAQNTIFAPSPVDSLRTGTNYYDITAIFQSNNGGQTYFNITGSVPSTDRKVGIIHQANSNNNSLYLATNNAVYYKNDDMADWELYNIGLPPMLISDIEINNVENHVLISSYGKGVWRSPVHDDALTNIKVVSSVQSSLFYPNPTSDDITLGFDLDEPSSIHLYALDGTLLQSYQREKIIKGETISLISYPKGTYILRIISDNHHINRKVLKQ